MAEEQTAPPSNNEGANAVARFVTRLPFNLYHRFREALAAPPPAEEARYRVEVLREEVWSGVAGINGQVDFESFDDARKVLDVCRKAAAPNASRSNAAVFRIKAAGKESRLGGGSIIVLSRAPWRGERPALKKPQTWSSIVRNLLADRQRDIEVRKNKVGVIDGECVFYAQYFDGRHWKDFQKEDTPHAAMADARMLRKFSRIPDVLLTPAELETREKEGIPKQASKLYSVRVIARNERAEQAVLHIFGKPNREENIIRQLLVTASAVTLLIAALPMLSTNSVRSPINVAEVKTKKEGWELLVGATGYASIINENVLQRQKDIDFAFESDAVRKNYFWTSFEKTPIGPILDEIIANDDRPAKCVIVSYFKSVEDFSDEINPMFSREVIDEELWRRASHGLLRDCVRVYPLEEWRKSTFNNTEILNINSGPVELSTAYKILGNILIFLDDYLKVNDRSGAAQ